MVTKNDLLYSDPVARAKYRRDWVKNNYKAIVGLRPNTDISVICVETNNQITVTPSTFFYRRKGEQVYQQLNSPYHYHVTRSLCHRVRIIVNEGGRIVGETSKCFAK